MKVILQDVCSQKTSNLAQKDLIGRDGDYPVYGASGYIGNINFYHQANKCVAVVKDGAGIGRTMLLPEKSTAIGTMQYLIPKENILPEYLFYAVKNMHLEKYYTGATIPHIYFKDYKNEKFNYVDLEQQLCIVNTLKLVEGIISKKTKQLEQLDNLVKSLFVEMFGDKAHILTMNDLCNIITDGTHQSPKFVSDGIPFLFVSNVSENKISYDTGKFISIDTYKELYKRTPIEKYDILLSTVGSYGHPAIVKSNKKFLFQRHIAYLKPKKELINSIYLHAAILSDEVQRQIESKVKGIAQKTLNLSEIKTLKIPLPSMTEQNIFATIVEKIDKHKLLIID